MTGLGPMVLAALLYGLVARSAAAEPLRREQIPEALRPWVEWALHGQEEHACAFLQDGVGKRQCLWPSRLLLDLDDRGGRFTQEWLVERRGLVPLPGDERRWPLDVRVGRTAPPVVPHGGVPSVELERGIQRVEGSFAWNELPDSLAIPEATGLVSLVVRGTPVAVPNRDPQGRLWLQRAESEQAEESRLDVVVQRRVSDGVPVLLETSVDLRVAGENREMVLPRLLPDRFVPLALTSGLPARLEPDGRLRLQARPGRWELDLTARHEGPALTLGMPPAEAPWDREEVWVFAAQPGLREVAVEGVPAVDPAQTELPDEWRRLPAYLMKPGATMTLAEKRRGDSDPAPDRLSLRRTWWLDFDGGGYTVRDEIRGSMSRSWRLEMTPPTVLGRAAVAGRDQFLTRLTADAPTGFEVHQSEVAVEADSRLAGDVTRIPAVGWNHDFDELRATLALPPGWRLFSATGADAVSSSWLGDWTMLDLFLVLIVALAFARLGGGWQGLLALATLALIYPENDAPRWLWLAALAAQALAGAVPEGRLARLARALLLVAVAVLTAVAVPFMVQQARQGVYPALEQPATVAGEISQATAPEAPRRRDIPLSEGSAEEAMPTMRDAVGALARAQRVREEPVPHKRGAAAVSRYADVDPNAAIATGPGIPRWHWRAVGLEWKGPVERTQELRLVLLPPRLNLLLALLRVVLTAALLLAVARALRGRPEPLVPDPAASEPEAIQVTDRAVSAGTAMLVVLVVLASAGGARADLPSPELLGELRARLLQEPACFPACASAARLRLEITPRGMVARLQVEASADTAVTLPGDARGWVPERVLVDGLGAPGLVRDTEGKLWVRLGPGKHQVLLDGALPAVESVSVPLPLRPHRVEVQADGWVVEGVRPDGTAEGSLQLLRVREGAGPERLQPMALPPFVRIEREIGLGLTREVTTRMVRVSPPGVPVLLEVPLLAGESVTTEGVRVEGGKALVHLGAQEKETSWHSMLAEAPALELVAPDAAAWTEVWRLETSPIWHVETQGIPSVHLPPHSGGRSREWQPWPGERVTIDVTRPAGVPGPTLTIDGSTLALRPGRHTLEATLTLAWRSSRGGQHVLALPAGATLDSVTIDGVQRPIREDGRLVTLPIAPGTQNAVLVWKSPQDLGTRFEAPVVGLGAPSVNAEVQVAMPPDRWILLVGGGILGPAVLFWTTLGVVLLVALALGRIRWTPLRPYHWLLLGVGLSQLEVGFAMVVAGWLLALGWRARRADTLRPAGFDLLQLVLVVWTAAAFWALFVAIQRGLLGLPEMQIDGNGSSASLLRWYYDRSPETLPRPWVISVPLLVYRLSMLAWSLWLAAALLRWLRWGWECFTTGGLWRPWWPHFRRRREAAAPAGAP